MRPEPNEPWQTLIQHHLDGIASDEEIERLSEKLESCSETRMLYLKLQQIHEILLLGEHDETSPNSSEDRVIDLITNLERFNQVLRRKRTLLTISSIAATIFLLLGGWGIWSQRPEHILEITAIHGSVQWTGDGGKVIEVLTDGQVLTGGTLETRSLESYAELRFRDGSQLFLAQGTVLTISDDGQKKLYLRAGVLSADVKKQPAESPMVIVTSSARFEILGTRLDVMVNPDRSKISVREGLVRAIRLADGKSVDIVSGNSVIASTESNNDFSSRRSDQTVHVWKADLERDHKSGEGQFVSAMLSLRTEIRGALQNRQLSRGQISEVYGARLAEIAEKDGILRAEPKRVVGSPFGNVIQIATLYVNHDKPNPVVLQQGSMFRVRGEVETASELRFGVGAFGTTRASAGRFFASREVSGSFDVKIPVSQMQRLRGRGNGLTAIGMEIFTCFCFTSDQNAQLEISSVELVNDSGSPKTPESAARPANNKSTN